MKKITILAVTLLLSFVFTVSSFAYYGLNDFEPVNDVDQAEEGLSLNSDSGAHATEVYISTRRDFTPNRACDPEKTNALFVKGVEGNNGNCIKVNRTFTLFPDSSFKGSFYLSADIKPVKFSSFAGMLIDYTDGSTSSGEVPHPNATIAARDKAHDYEYILYTGYGFTFLAGNHNAVRLFVNASKTGTVDYIDIDLGFDVTAAWHRYSMYEDLEDKRNYFYVDDVLKAYFDFSQENGMICDPLGSVILSNTNNFFGNETGCMTFMGDDIEVYFDNLDVNLWSNLPKGITATFKAASFDTIMVNGEMASFQEADGNASSYLDKIGRRVDGTNGKTTSFTLRGWAGFEEEMVAIGYRIGDNKPVFKDTFFTETPDAVKQAGGEFAKRFEIKIPLDYINGDTKIVVVAKFANGSVVELTPESYENCPDISFIYGGPKTEIFDYSEDGHGKCFDSATAGGVAIVYEGDVEIEGADTINLRGWVGFDSDFVEKYGYVIDDGEPVYSGILTNVSETDPVRAISNGGEFASRFSITIPLTGYTKGEHTAVPVARLESGEVYSISDVCFYFVCEDGPDPTAKPAATPTEEPKATPTKEPATEAPEATEEVKTTEAPSATEAPKAEDTAKSETRSNTGLIIVVIAFVAVAAAVAVILIVKKKKAK